MQAVYSDRYQIDLGLHVFPTAKYRLIAERLSQRPDITFVEPEPATWEQLALVHTAEYLAKMRDGTLTRDRGRSARAAMVGRRWSTGFG